MVTHASGNQAVEIANYFESHPEFRLTPRLMLVNEAAPLSPELSGQTTIVRNSKGGEISDINFNAPEIHLAGGFFTVCMTNSVCNLVDHYFAQPNRTHLDLVVHLGLTYDDHADAMLYDSILKSLQARHLNRTATIEYLKQLLQEVFLFQNRLANPVFIREQTQPNTEYLFQIDNFPRTGVTTNVRFTTN